ncbi:MarR family winged helix-turn-helix transcriptional regulator [Paenibacillus flagellatus]|uniref:MarR family winged helix-turn-helix transcriptional regulator n=1 Tax=Paenibacillus flagellatus TaxID=2211139 RepID=UPI001305186D|nr:MarR family transcriptional regulator [Paenibacillus flagellatus]
MDSLVDRFQTALYTFKRSLESDLLHKLKTQITAPQMFMLHFVSRHGACRLTQLADKMEVKPSAVTVMIDRLEKSGYVTRTHDTADRRSVLVQVTPEGIDILEKAMLERKDALARFLARLEPDEVRTVTELMEKLAGAGEESDPSALRRPGSA